MPRKFDRPPNSGARLSWSSLEADLRAAIDENNDDNRTTDDNDKPADRNREQKTRTR